MHENIELKNWKNINEKYIFIYLKFKLTKYYFNLLTDISLNYKIRSIDGKKCSLNEIYYFFNLNTIKKF